MKLGLVVIPTYNEIENIEAIIRAVFQLEKPFHVLIVDDNSPDKTFEKVQMLQNEFPDQLFLEVRKKKSGLGTAYVHGFKWALERKYDFIFEMDCRVFPDATSYNVIAEIRGSEKPEEIIVFGGHLDSWDAGEGAHDDGAGVIHCLEALRILKVLNYKPKHTLRIVFFMNEENGNHSEWINEGES